MGFECPVQEGLLEQLAVDKDPRGHVKAEYGEHATSIRGVYAAGDARRGQSLVVWALAEGRKAARAIDLFLMGESSLPEH